MIRFDIHGDYMIRFDIHGVISFGKYVMSFSVIKLDEEKSYRVSPNVASNFSEPTSHPTCRIVCQVPR